ncbi:hypothetical protein [Nonomuraea sp. NPDC005650]|uniref:hypothetical protein n=1 Tax=Nonomuraea sp. NPDC005650 TaxID=3157045 RepID=UPI0033BF2088
MTSVTFRDETATGRELAAFSLPGLPERITARELVRLRVREEVARHNAGGRLDWAEQADAAEAAFARNGFLLLVGERQIEDLDAEIDLTADPVVSFVKLVPLAGG